MPEETKPPETPAYERPRLTKHGSLAAITQSGTSRSNDMLDGKPIRAFDEKG
jgi:hypothetical protein